MKKLKLIPKEANPLCQTAAAGFTFKHAWNNDADGNLERWEHRSGGKSLVYENGVWIVESEREYPKDILVDIANQFVKDDRFGKDFFKK